MAMLSWTRKQNGWNILQEFSLPSWAEPPSLLGQFLWMLSQLGHRTGCSLVYGFIVTATAARWQWRFNQPCVMWGAHTHNQCYERTEWQTSQSFKQRCFLNQMLNISENIVDIYARIFTMTISQIMKESWVMCQGENIHPERTSPILLPYRRLAPNPPWVGAHSRSLFSDTSKRGRC